MKVNQHNNFNPDYPETFDWASVDCTSEAGFIDAAIEIVTNIRNDLKTNERNLAPGLRAALNIIAGYANI